MKLGVAAAAVGEEAKAEHYLEMINDHGGDFFPWSAGHLVFGLHLHYRPYLQLPLLKCCFQTISKEILASEFVIYSLAI